MSHYDFVVDNDNYMYGKKNSYIGVVFTYILKGEQKNVAFFSMVCKMAFCQNITKRTKILESGA